MIGDLATADEGAKVIAGEAAQGCRLGQCEQLSTQHLERRLKFRGSKRPQALVCWVPVFL